MLNEAIVLSAGAFGSIYLFSTILKELNKYWLKNAKIPYSFYILNGFTMAASTFTLSYFIFKHYIK